MQLFAREAPRFERPSTNKARMQHEGLEGRLPCVEYTTPNTEIAQLKSIIRTTQKDLRQPIGNVAILVAGDQARAHDRGKKLARYLKDAGVHANYLSSSQFRLDADCVKVISLHTSKGLEFPMMIIVDVHNGVLPRDVYHLTT